MAKSMKGATMPKEHFEQHHKGNAPVCGEKYGKEMGNPESLDKMTAGLSNYVKKNKMKYE